MISEQRKRVYWAGVFVCYYIIGAVTINHYGWLDSIDLSIENRYDKCDVIHENAPKLELQCEVYDEKDRSYF